jgi:multicomponent Na+:H+ antiporter subunit G
MEILNGIRFVIGIGLIVLGVVLFITEMIGIFKFKYVLNRMHIAGMGDTMGLSLTLLGTIVLSGLNFTSLKMGLVLVFLWLASPVASHLIARFEVTTNEELENYCKLPEEEE